VKIGIYLQSDGDALGGSEYWLSCLAQEFSARHDVTVVHHKAAMTVAKLAAFSGHDLSRVVAERILPGEPVGWPTIAPGCVQAATLSGEFDLFIAITHRIPPPCRARLGVLIVLFPLEPRWALWPWSDPAIGVRRWDPRKLVRRVIYETRWWRRFGSYHVRTALSAFAQRWTRELWAIDTAVMYPPNEIAFPSLPKQNRVISIGRFTARGVSKAQVELTRMFRDVLRDGDGQWEYACIGAVGDVPDDIAYFTRVKTEAQGHPICVQGGVDRVQLKQELARSRIFWHAAGFDIDEQREPQLCEHFGIVTVEAMAAGAVPVVIGRGGQREIVRHGLDGFLCTSLDEMATQTRRLMDDPDLLSRMSTSAQARAHEFSAQRSIDRLIELVQAGSSLRL
jgi:glycosyltransferase involved in cell wall biosynthesis